MTISEKMRRLWQDPVKREQMLRGLAKGNEASRNLSPRIRAESAIRVSRTMTLKRLEAR